MATDNTNGTHAEVRESAPDIGQLPGCGPDPRWQTAIAHPELQTLDAPVTLVCHFCGQAARYAYLHGERRRNGWLAWIRCCFCGQRDPYFVTRP